MVGGRASCGACDGIDNDRPRLWALPTFAYVHSRAAAGIYDPWADIGRLSHGPRLWPAVGMMHVGYFGTSPAYYQVNPSPRQDGDSE
jgi:hypothetical protein